LVSPLFSTPDTADPFGPKAVQASMGALFQLKTGIVDLPWFETLKPGTPVIGTFLEGEAVFGAALPGEGLVILGNEGHGIRAELASKVTRRLTVPRFGAVTESLNVGAAAAILMAEFRRGGK
jgi:RNA methyltransferase, TrmH family